MQNKHTVMSGKATESPKGNSDMQIPRQPTWIHPNEVMKIHNLKRKQKALQARLAKKPTAGTDTVAISIVDSSRHNGKRSNPFMCPQNKKICIESEAIPKIDSTSNMGLFQMLYTPAIEVPDEVMTSFTAAFQNQVLNVPAHQEKQEKPKETWNCKLPFDWSLKSALRFVSPKPFPWTSTLTASQQASGVTGFVRCLDFNSSSNTLDASPNAAFHQNCLYWQYPSFPWLRLFPRIKSAAVDKGKEVVPLSLYMQKAIHEEWCESLHCIFQLLRTRQCPYFYVCANTFTCLFRTAGIAGLSEIHALVTPTTRGLRQAFKADDIEFTLPLYKSTKGNSPVSSDTGYETSGNSEDLEKEDDIEDDDEGAMNWLASIGVDGDSLLGTHSFGSNVSNNWQDIDKLPQSLVLIQGCDTQGLINFLVNSKSCMSNMGPLAGVPPTILAPVAFRSAALMPLKVRVPSTQNKQNQFSLEITGPIMPHLISSICTLLSQTNDTFRVKLLTCDGTRSTAAFNRVWSDDKTTASTQATFAQENLRDCGLSSSVLKKMCAVDGPTDSVVSDIEQQNGYLKWK